MQGAGPAPRILFIDDQIVVVDKPPGIPSVPARTPDDPPDVSRILVTGALAGSPLPEAVHRLDRDTSGILVLARTGLARRALGRALGRLDAPQRRCVESVLLAGQSLRQVALRERTSAMTIHRRLRSALVLLRQELSPLAS